MKQAEKQKKIALSGALGFENFYASIFGARWQALKAALEKEPPLCALSAGGEKPYFLDAASIFCAGMLPLTGAKNILDMCAAPGGKMLSLALRMESDALLCANEKSAARKLRLQNTSKNCLPLSIQNRIKIRCADSAKLGSVKNKAQFQKYDAILLDAPCSSERHLLLNDRKYIESWSPARIRTVSREQWALVQSGFALLKRGGFLLYATCALGENENDAIIEKLLASHRDALCVETPHQDAAIDAAIGAAAILCPEKTRFGCRILPDTSGGAGPLYWSLIGKKSENFVRESQHPCCHEFSRSENSQRMDAPLAFFSQNHKKNALFFQNFKKNAKVGFYISDY